MAKSSSNYDDDKDTEQWRTSLKKINTCFSHHILDMYLKDIEFEKLQDELKRR